MNHQYKLTLNLPKTEFSMHGNLVKKELDILMRWNNDNLYHMIRAAKKGKKIFVLHDGPPYANGNIHIGHSINKILKDIIIKYKSLSGFDSPYIPGWDCHGLPIELKVEQKFGKPNKKITAAEFRMKCREYATIQINNQRKDFIRLGILGDWFHPYLTMDFKTEANTIRLLGKIIKNGYLHQGTKPVHWCIDCCSALAEAEVEYCKKISLSIYVIFEAVNQNTIKQKFGLLNDINDPISLVIWTTTPWTIPASRAISLSMKIEYALVQIEGKILILAKDLVENVMKRINIEDYVLLSTINGKELEFIRFKHPFLNFDIPIILGDHIALDTGTGAVHTAGGHGLDDYNISKKYNLEIANLVEVNGTYVSHTHPLLDGINIFQSQDIIIDLLKNKGALFHFEKIQHNYPYCWRHKTPTIFRTTLQWFISINKKGLREKSLKKIKNVKWIPNWGKERIESMVANRPDWCISRQRTWGVPMSLFVHKETNNLHPRTLDLIEKIANLVEIQGIQAWWDLNPNDLIGEDANLYEKIPDTLDVWFDSGSTHASVVDIRPEFSGHGADMYVEGTDQYRGWFMSSLITSIAINNKAPYRKVLAHGFTVDSHGRKMSKSVGNTISPQEIINKLGADILRLLVASTDYTNEVVISDKILKHTTDNYRRIRNTARFLLGNLGDFDPSKDIVSPKNMIILDRWAVNCAKKAQDDIINAYNFYNFHEVIQRIIRFCSIEMGSFYLNVIKDRQYTTKIDSIERRSCQTALYHIIEALVRWIAPIISFTADEIWRYLPGKHEKYVFISEWYERLFSLNENEIMNSSFWEEILKVRSEVNKVIEQARNIKKIRSSLEVTATLYAEPELEKKLTAIGTELKFILLTSNVVISNYDHATTDAIQSKIFKGLKITLNKANGKKCQRCWHYTIDVGKIEDYMDICARCVSNIFGNGERRKFV